MNNKMLLGVKIGLSVLVVLFSSCNKDWFDVKSNKRQTVPSSLQDFEYLLDFSTLYIGSPGLGEIGSDGHHMPENRWQTLADNDIINAQKNAYTWTYNYKYVLIDDWNRCYERVFYCNLVLDGLKKITPQSEEQEELFNRIKGNALFHKAKSYLDLAQVYAQPFNALTATTDLGLPLKETIDVTEPAYRSTVKQTYDEIVNCLVSAIRLLPTLPRFLTRGSKASAYGLLARTFLVMGDYVKAGNYADSCLLSYNILVDFNTIPATNTNLGRFNAEVLIHSEMATKWVFNASSGYIFINGDLYDLYNDNDLRKTRFFTKNSAGIVFKGSYAAGTARFSGLATDEVYLIRAECHARRGNIEAALDDLNALLRSRWDSTATYNPVTAASSDEVLEKVLQERKKELILRGIRWSDLRRLNQESRFSITLTRSIGGQTYVLEPNSHRYTLPIPNDVMSLAPMIQQNPGWDN